MDPCLRRDDFPLLFSHQNQVDEVLEPLFHRNVYLSQHTPYPTLPMELRERITIDPNICHGKPCIRGLRYPVEVILELLSAGMTTEEILADYEDLEREDVLAVLAYAAAS